LPNHNKRSVKNTRKPFQAFTLLVDLQHYPEGQFIRGTSLLVPKEHAQTVHATNVVEEKYWYWDERGAANYIAMTQEEGYDVLDKTLNLLQSKIDDILDKACEFFKDSRPHPANGSLPQIDLVILGVGSATKENLILRNVLRKYGFTHKSKFGPINYIPLDISFPLLQNSLRSIFGDPELKECIIRGNLLVNPVLTDFLTRPTGFLGKNVHKLIVAQGIVWNAPIPELLSAFRHFMTSDSLLLIDVEFVGGRTDEEITSNYKGKAAIEFFYHPLGLLHSASQAKQDTFFNGKFGQPVSYRRAFSDFSDKKGDVIPVIVTWNTLDEFVKKHGLPEEAKSKIQLSPGEKSKIVIVLFKPKPSQPNMNTVVLGYSTRFEYDEFNKFLNEAGLEPVGKWLDDTKDPRKAVFGHYLLKLKNQGRLGPTDEQHPAPVSSPTGPPWTGGKIRQEFGEAWRIEYSKLIGSQTFDVIAEKKGWRHSEILVCDIEKDELTCTEIDNFSKKITEAKRSMSGISKAAIFCDKNVANGVFKYCEEKKAALSSLRLKFSLVLDKNDLKALRDS
jgi:hypothetical protein